MSQEFDLIVIGGGSAGFAAAIKASELGFTAAVVESGTIGGTCLNRGCIPTKNLLHAAELYYQGKLNPFPGIHLEAKELNLARLIEQKDELVAELRRAKYLDLLEANPGITLVTGRAEFVAADTVAVGGRLLTARSSVIATGARPVIPPIDGLAEVDYLTSTEALDLKELPSSLLVIGGRLVALEFAQMYSRFGTRVTVLQRSPRIIPEEEEEISEALRGYLEEEGIILHAGVEFIGVRQEGTTKVVTARLDGQAAEFRGERLLVAAGRRPNTEGLGLEVTGVELSPDGSIRVDDEMKTTAPNIWAAGDVTGPPMLVTLAAHEGAVAGENALSCCRRKVDRSAVPHALFTSPAVASVGLKEREAREKGYTVVTRTLPFNMVPKAAAIRDTRGLIKMVAEEGTHRILGVHVLGPLAPEIIHQATLAVKHGMTLEEIAGMIHVYPTMSEALKLVAQSFSRDVSRLSCCAE